MARLNSIKCLSGIASQKTHDLLVVGVFEGGSVTVPSAVADTNAVNLGDII